MNHTVHDAGWPNVHLYPLLPTLLHERDCCDSVVQVMKVMVNSIITAPADADSILTIGAVDAAFELMLPSVGQVPSSMEE